VIIDIARFIEEGKPVWDRLEKMLARMEDDVALRLDLTQLKELHYLYQRASADLARVSTFSSEPETRRYLESLVARAYAEIHETRGVTFGLAPVRWFFRTFPQTFRRHLDAFWIATAVMGVGMLFGGLTLILDPEARRVIMPAPHAQMNPSERVAAEESMDRARGILSHRATFSAFLMTHNIRVSIAVLALGISWGVGTILLLFYNGVIIGAISLDYVVAGEAGFLVGWLLPHGAVEIPAILIAGQAGLVLANALIGWGTRMPLRARMRGVSRDLVTLICGLAVFLVWAGLVESFFSQYHEPLLPYAVKIGFGTVQLALVFFFLSRSGREPAQ
jgi:uncharacterized membrane protein SpoIIM required for sporulation